MQKSILLLCFTSICFFYQTGWSQSPAKNTSKQADKNKAKKVISKKTKQKKDKPVTIIISTTLGNIEVLLDTEKAPITVKNYLNYVDKNFYKDLVFHRVINGFMIQGGGFDKNLKLRPTEAAIKNEAHNGLKNLRGTIAMARTPDPHSASSQFFINLTDNKSLDYRAPLPRDFGYAVFGKVTKGMDTVDKIAKVKTESKGQMRDVPADPVVIKSITRKDGKK